MTNAAMFLLAFLIGGFFEMVARDYWRHGERGYSAACWAMAVPMFAMGLLAVGTAIGVVQ